MLKSNRSARRLQQIYRHMTTKYHTLSSLPKSSPFSAQLSPDPEVATPDKVNKEVSQTPRHLKSGHFTYTIPEPRKKYQYITSSVKALKDLGLDPENEPKSEYYRSIVSGEKFERSPHPYAQAYAGYQFGEFAGQLGDGRVVNIFTVENPSNGKSYELQLKGAGKTPFSRFADGKAVLRSSIREFVISEALNAIGIPSTRALAITALPGTLAQRYGAETCAVVCRMAESWIRVGNFDLCRYRGDREGLKKLSNYILDHVLKNKFSKVTLELIKNDPKLQNLGEITQYDKLYLEIVARNAKSVAYWHAYGFLNGVLNTDNTSILGLAMDFGPFSFMDRFDPNYTPNHEDYDLRYNFKNTPSSIWFNMVKLGEDMAELIGAGDKLLNDPYFVDTGLKEEWIQPLIQRAGTVIDIAGEFYEKIFIEEYLRLMCNRLGIKPKDTDHSEVLAIMFEMLQITKLDYNNFFAILQETAINSDDKFDYEITPMAFLSDSLKKPENKEERDKVLGELRSFLATFKARVEEEQVTDHDRYNKAKKYNPLFVPRNWIMDEVIESTKDNDFNPLYLDKLMKMATNPYDRTKWGSEEKDLEQKWISNDDQDKQMLQCSCSS